MAGNARVRALAALFAAAALAAAPRHARSGEADAIVHLLNSRVSGSARLYAKAAREVAEDAAKGKPVQQFLIASLSLGGSLPPSVRIDEETRERYFAASRGKITAMAERLDNPLAWYLLALESDDMAKLERAAALGNVQALNALGTLKLQSNPGASPGACDPAVAEECFALFSRAADAGDANGLNNLGICLLRGWGCEPDAQRSFDCFTRAAEAGHPEAMNNLARFHREGLCVPKDLSKAAACFARSASLGNVWGQLNYAIALLRGEGVERNAARGAELAKALAEKGIPEAMELLSGLYGRGEGGLAEDPYLASVWKIRALAARGDANAAKWLEANGE